VADHSDLLAGIDIGTTNCKVGLYTTDGEPVVERRQPTPRAADDVVAGVLGDLRSCLDQVGAQPLAVGVTGVAEGGVPLDRTLRPLRPLLWWYDTCAAAEARWLADTVGQVDLFRVTGVDVAAKTPLAVWLWLRHGEPAVLDRMRAWVGLPELVATVLCGVPTTARTFAGRSGAYDQLTDRYDENLLALPGIHPAQLPEPTGVGTAVGGVLRAGTPVVVAGHDHLVGAYAAGARSPGDVADSLGTAEAVVTVSEHPAPESAAGTGVSFNRTADGRHWALVSGFPHSGRLVDRVCADRGYAGLTDRPTGIVVLPYPAGRAAPAPDPDRRMSVHGLALEHTPADVLVAVLEGACFHVRWMAERQAEHVGDAVGTVVVLGGPSRNQAWMDVKAHVLPGPVRLVRSTEAASAGAALLAGSAIGLPAPILPSDTLPRDDALAARYDAIYRDGFLSRVLEAA
jgi:sugar (pentulose or hexulose) kinase